MAREDYENPARDSYPYDKNKQAGKKATVATPCPAYEEMMEAWDLPEALMGGTRVLRKEGIKWLPREEKEGISSYRNRLKRSYLFNAYKRTVMVLSGLPFERAVLVDNVPSRLQYLEKDIDNNGADITDFANTLLQDLLVYGLTHIYVDSPFLGEQITLEDVERMKLRPYFTHYSPSTIISWDSVKVGGVEVLTRLRVKETVIEEDGEWGYKEVKQIRVMYPDRHVLYREKGENTDNWQVYDTIPNSLGYIPLITIYGNKTGFMTAEPPLEDLAWLNLQHYQKSSNVDNIMHYANLPILFGSGFEKGELEGVEIAANRAITASDPNAKLGYIEHTGKAIGVTLKSIKNLEEQMAALGSDLIVRKSVDRQTAAARKIDQSESLSLLQIMINNIETGLSQAYELAGKWVDIAADGVVVTIADNLDTPSGPNFLDLLAEHIISNGGMSVEQAIVELKRRGALSDRYEIPKGEVVSSEEEDEEDEMSEIE